MLALIPAFSRLRQGFGETSPRGEGGVELARWERFTPWFQASPPGRSSPALRLTGRGFGRCPAGSDPKGGVFSPIAPSFKSGTMKYLSAIAKKWRQNVPGIPCLLIEPLSVPMASQTRHESVSQ